MALLLKNYGDWIYRAVVLLALGAFYVGQSKAEYVTRADLAVQLTASMTPLRSEVMAVSVQVTALDKSMAVLAEQNRVTDRHETTLKDFDIRLRAIESRTSASR